jgi:hypothetical protein
MLQRVPVQAKYSKDTLCRPLPRIVSRRALTQLCPFQPQRIIFDKVWSFFFRLDFLKLQAFLSSLSLKVQPFLSSLKVQAFHSSVSEPALASPKTL